MNYFKIIKDAIIDNWIGILIGGLIGFIVFQYSGYFGMQIVGDINKSRNMLIVVGAAVGLIIDANTRFI